MRRKVKTRPEILNLRDEKLGNVPNGLIKNAVLPFVGI